jgi:protocatechuate 3,4-dioxygenase beta subunit
VRGAGFAAASRHVVVTAGGTVTVSLQPGAGVASTITVLDETGRPLPTAAIEVTTEDGPHVQDDAGVQQLVLRTDALGRCRLHGLSPGPAKVRVLWDVRDATFDFTAGADTTLVLKPQTE